METIVTRFAPSPTGFLHIGGARTALFNWLYARHMKGKFILRIEDTDVARSTRESVDAIFQALHWLSIDWDEGPFYQTQRYDIYNQQIEKLLETGHAYYCNCSPERLETMRKEAMASGGKPKYDGLCREKGLACGDDTVVRFKAPMSGTTVVEDVIKGNIVFQNAELDDFIIARSDRTPTYNFCVVVDDLTLGINMVIRGDDHLNNTPKQILLYRALEGKLPTFGHVPMVLGDDRARLSKRHGAMSITAYREMGYLPDALINYLVRLGWSYGDQEFFTREELIEKFSIENIGRSAGIFNPEKLLALNAEHIKTTPPRKLIRHLGPFLEERGIVCDDTEQLKGIIRTLNSRSKTLIDLADGAMFYFADKVEYDEKAAKKFLKPNALEPMNLLAEELEKLSDFSEKSLEGAFLKVMEATDLKLGKIAQPVRVALTGGTVSPGIFEIIEVLDKEKTLSRLRDGAAYIRENTEAG